jgi:hypothetical protein
MLAAGGPRRVLRREALAGEGHCREYSAGSRPPGAFRLERRIRTLQDVARLVDQVKGAAEAVHLGTIDPESDFGKFSTRC